MKIIQTLSGWLITLFVLERWWCISPYCELYSDDSLTLTFFMDWLETDPLVYPPSTQSVGEASLWPALHNAHGQEECVQIFLCSLCCWTTKCKVNCIGICWDSDRLWVNVLMSSMSLVYATWWTDWFKCVWCKNVCVCDYFNEGDANVHPRIFYSICLSASVKWFSHTVDRVNSFRAARINWL